MPVSNALRRLLRVRDLEEEQHKAALESALGELHRLESALSTAHGREHAGRLGVAASAHSADRADRVAGLVETEAGRRGVSVLTPWVAAAANRAAQLRAEYLASRVERRQVETVIREAEALDAVDRGRREQQAADEWFGTRRHGMLAQNADRTTAATEPRQIPEKHEMKDSQESSSLPEAELRSNL
jgi:hypothetical protein